jgi:methionyl-tRNA formyltransferase
VTQPDRPAGRKRRLTPPPLKTFAIENGLTILQPENISDTDFLKQIEALAADFFVVVSYGRLLPRTVIDMPRYATVNLHPSLLPRLRGAAPVPWAILNGDARTGVTIIKLTTRMDAGPILAQKAVPILREDTAGTLSEKLARLGSRLLTQTLINYYRGDLRPVEQDESEATHAPKIKKEDARINWSKSASEVDRLVRAMNPEPGAYSFLIRGAERTRCIIYKGSVQAEDEAGRSPAGSIADASRDGIEVLCGKGTYVVQELQAAGKISMSAAQYIRGHRLGPGDRFE